MYPSIQPPCFESYHFHNTVIKTKVMRNMYHSIVKVAAFKTTQKFQNAFRCLSYLTFLSELGAMD